MIALLLVLVMTFVFLAICYAFNMYIPLAPPLKMLFFMIILIIFLMSLAWFFGGLGGSGPRIHWR
jgi:hypothetical protein